MTLTIRIKLLKTEFAKKCTRKSGQLTAAN